MKRVLVDSGPLVAILSSRDEHHESCVAALRHTPGPLLSCWPVITEAAWLLRTSAHAVQKLLTNLDGGFVELLPLGGSEAEALAALMKKYADIRPQLADATLVYLAGREQLDTIFTLDQRDFSIYRTGRGRPFRIVPNMQKL